MLSEGTIDGNVLCGDRVGFRPCRPGPFRSRQSGHLQSDAVERPAQIDRRRPGGEQQCVRRRKSARRRIGAQRQRKAVGRGRADQRRATHLHRPDGVRSIGCGGELDGRTGLRQARLIEDLDAIATGRGTQRAQVGCFHAIF